MTCVACSYLPEFLHPFNCTVLYCMVLSLYHIVSKRILVIQFFQELVFFVELNTSSITMSTVSFEGLVYNTQITKSLENK